MHLQGLELASYWQWITQNIRIYNSIGLLAPGGSVKRNAIDLDLAGSDASATSAGCPPTNPVVF